MTDEEKLEKMFTEVHGEMTGSCSIEVSYNDYEPDGIHVMKDGNVCWSKSKIDILFDYITKGW
jgi:hypothetical protein